MNALKQSVSHYPYYNRLLPIEKKQDPIEEVFAGQLKQVLKSLKGVISEAALVYFRGFFMEKTIRKALHLTLISDILKLPYKQHI